MPFWFRHNQFRRIAKSFHIPLKAKISARFSDSPIVLHMPQLENHSGRVLLMSGRVLALGVSPMLPVLGGNRRAGRELERAVALRLRAVMFEFQITTHPKLAKVCGTSRSAVNNWLMGLNLPRVPEMIRLCETTGITLDWIYRGAIHTMNAQVAIRLSRVLDAQMTE